VEIGDELWTLGDLVAEAKTRLDAMPAPKNGQVRAVPDERTARYYATLGLIDRPAAMRGRTAFYNRRHLAQLIAIKRMQTAEHSLADIQAMWSTIDDDTLTRISGVLLKSTLVPKPALGGKAKSGRNDFWKAEIDAKAGGLRADIKTSNASELDERGRDRGALSPNSHRGSGRASELDEQGRDRGAPSFEPPYMYPVPPKSMPMLAGPRPQPAPRKPAELRVEIAPGVAITIALPTERSIAISPADLDAVRVAAASVVTELANRGLIARGTGTLEEKP
jgi:DNA-binding transcriptional MerR regulator